VDSVASSSAFLWVRNGSVDVASAEDEVGILLDVGALDVKERAGQPNTVAVVLTEDEIIRPLERILESSGFDLTKTVILPYYGVTGVKQLQPLVRVIRATNTKAKIILHRDRDFLTDEEIEKWKVDVRAVSVEPFITRGRDLESYFIDERYLTEMNAPTSESEFGALIDGAVCGLQSQLISEFVNGRTDILRKAGKAGSINPGGLAVEAGKAVSADARRFCGKAALRAVRSEFQRRFARNLVDSKASARLRDDFLAGIAKKSFKAVA
jgi:hypothetical protein